MSFPRIRFKVYDFLSLFIISIIIILMSFHWKTFPVSTDIYYHISVMLGFEKAGGLVFWDFWEFAPIGRPHLYPPLLHSLMLFLSEFLAPLTVGRIISFAMFPATLFTTWIFSREIYSPEAGFYTITVISSFLQLLRSHATTSATSLGLVLLPLVFLAIYKKKQIASIILLSAVLYSHIGMGVVIFLAVIFFSLCDKERSRLGLITAGGALVLYLPWGVHTLLHLSSLMPDPAARVMGGNMLILPALTAIPGIYLCFKRKKEHFIPICMLFAMIPIIPVYYQRFTNASLIPLSMLSGIAFSEFHKRLTRRQKIAFAVGILLLFNTICISLLFKDFLVVILKNSLFLFLVTGKGFGNELTHENLELARLTMENTQEDDIIFAENSSLGSFITAMTGRPQVLGMWYEVSSEVEPTVQAASLFIVSKNYPIPESSEKVGETEKHFVFESDGGEPLHVDVAAVPKALIYLCIFLAAFLVIRDFM